jgi:hypothetical protein
LEWISQTSKWNQIILLVKGDNGNWSDQSQEVILIVLEIFN